MSESVFRVDFDDGDLESGGALDDLAITGDRIRMLRIERMDDGVCWGRIYVNDGPDIILGWNCRGKLKMSAEND